MNKTVVLLVLFTMSVAAGCSSMKIETRADPEADFSEFNSYSWLRHPQGSDARVGPQVGMWIVGAIDEELAGKGLHRRDGEETDFQVGYHAAVQGQMEVSNIDSYYGYGVPRSSPWTYYNAGSEQQQSAARYYNQGVIVIDIVDVRLNRLVWRGTAQAEVKDDVEPDQQQARIREAVRKIMADFPPN
jgi:hypothetical protein